LEKDQDAFGKRYYCFLILFTFRIHVAGDNSGGKGSLDMLTETVENYEQAFNKIKEVTGVSDVQDLVKRFTQMEDQNFSLFNYVNEQNNEIEKISEEVSTILESIDKLKADAEILETERKATLKELEVSKSSELHRFRSSP
jgi:hypothetical protein